MCALIPKGIERFDEVLTWLYLIFSTSPLINETKLQLRIQEITTGPSFHSRVLLHMCSYYTTRIWKICWWIDWPRPPSQIEYFTHPWISGKPLSWKIGSLIIGILSASFQSSAWKSSLKTGKKLRPMHWDHKFLGLVKTATTVWSSLRSLVISKYSRPMKNWSQLIIRIPQFPLSFVTVTGNRSYRS